MKYILRFRIFISIEILICYNFPISQFKSLIKPAIIFGYVGHYIVVQFLKRAINWSVILHPHTERTGKCSLLLILHIINKYIL